MIGSALGVQPLAVAFLVVETLRLRRRVAQLERNREVERRRPELQISQIRGETMADTFRDSIPLGVSGVVTIPSDKYRKLVRRDPDGASGLFTEEERIAYVARRLAQAIDRPLTAPGSGALAGAVLAKFAQLDLMPPFAEKALESLRDGHYHSRMAISPSNPPFAISFVAWNGTHREVQSQRLGNYLSPLFSTARRLVEHGIQLGGFLEMDAYVRDNPDPDDPGKPLDEVFQLDLEYSYMPGRLLGSSAALGAYPLNAIMLNPDLCSPEEAQTLKELTMR